MKKSILIFLLIGVAIIISGCSKDDPSIPDSIKSDQETPYLKAQMISFTGTSTPTAPPNPGDNAWYDEATDERVTGVGVWDTELPVLIVDAFTIKLWGTAELTVDNGLGKWEMKFWGTQTFANPGYDGPFEIVAYAVGVGTKGDVKGMFAEWTYTMNFDGTPETLFYVTEGYVADKQLTNTLKTVKASGPFEMTPPPNDCGGDLFQIYVSGSGNCSHLGKFTVENFGCFDVFGGMVQVGEWLGFLTAANGDEIHTELIYSWEVDGLDWYLYDILGGTGKFEGACGYLENWGSTDMETLIWELEGEGMIVH